MEGLSLVRHESVMDAVSRVNFKTNTVGYRVVRRCGVAGPEVMSESDNEKKPGAPGMARKLVAEAGFSDDNRCPACQK